MSTIFGDYVAGFLGTTRQGNPYRLQPFDVSSIKPYEVIVYLYILNP